MRKLIMLGAFAIAFGCSEDQTSELNEGSAIDSGVPCDPATDFFCVDMPDSGVQTTVDAGSNNNKGDAGKVDGKGDAGDKPGGNGKTLYRHGGQLNTSTGSGQYTLESLNNGTVECMIVFEVASATVATSCPSAQCDFAWSIELGTKTTSIAGNACAFFGDSAGDTLLYGHRAPAQLVIEKQGSWTDFGESTVTGDLWDFGFEYSF